MSKKHKPPKVPPLHLAGDGDLPAPPENDIVEGQDTYIVNACSGHVTWHDPDTCVGEDKCEKIELNHMDVRIRNEHCAWARAGMSTDMVGHNVWNMDTQLMAVIDAVEEIIGRDKLNEIYKQKLLDKLHTYREKMEPEIRNARSRSKIALPDGINLGGDGPLQ